jgi:filamentous hemagglutinin
MRPGPSTDCAEIAADLAKAAGGEGRILRIEPRTTGTLNLLENGEVGGNFFYHEVFTDGRYVFDPRLSATPIPEGDWWGLMRGLNPGNLK